MASDSTDFLFTTKSSEFPSLKVSEKNSK